MSILNMMLAGSGGGEFKVATPLSSSTTSLVFNVDNEPSEYLLFLALTTRISNSTVGSYYISYTAHTTEYDKRGSLTYYISGATQGARFRVDNSASASYSSGLLTFTASGSYSFQSHANFILLYR